MAGDLRSSVYSTKCNDNSFRKIVGPDAGEVAASVPVSSSTECQSHSSPSSGDPRVLLMQNFPVYGAGSQSKGRCVEVEPTGWGVRRPWFESQLCA